VRSGEILFWLDTVASLKRIFIALALSASIGLAWDWLLAQSRW